MFIIRRETREKEICFVYTCCCFRRTADIALTSIIYAQLRKLHNFVSRAMIRAYLSVGGGILLAATPVKVAEVPVDPMPTVYMKKPSELPLYTPLHES